MVVTLKIESNMKKQYIKPEMLTVCIAHTGIICTSEITDVHGNFSEPESLNLGGGGNGEAKSRGGWFDDEEDW